jgi:hypothetical protein
MRHKTGLLMVNSLPDPAFAGKAKRDRDGEDFTEANEDN